MSSFFLQNLLYSFRQILPAISAAGLWVCPAGYARSIYRYIQFSNIICVLYFNGQFAVCMCCITWNVRHIGILLPVSILTLLP